ncbi:HTH domain-containing protein [uncultured Tateyamaria sp.]|uniref:HTH domain-containing protein n=1 Tax=uncultured Tateyamaria sp. TaxID=455651 RepID=UPI002625B6A9|nr:HTH domain-containing protein [uncultured Tateyamaria sp.]
MDSCLEGAASKCLMVLEKILTSPALSRDQIAGDLGLNRSAVYRAIKILAAKGYVRPTLCGTRYRITERAETVFSAVSVAHENADDIALAILEAAKRFSIHADIAMVEGPGTICDFETTDRLRALCTQPLSMAWSSLAHAALAHMSSNQRQRHIQSYLFRANRAEKTEMMSAHFIERLDEYAEQGGVLEPCSSGISQALINRVTGEVVGAVRFRHYANANRSCAGCSVCNVSRQISDAGVLQVTGFRQSSSNSMCSAIARIAEK